MATSFTDFLDQFAIMPPFYSHSTHQDFFSAEVAKYSPLLRKV